MHTICKLWLSKKKSNTTVVANAMNHKRELTVIPYHEVMVNHPYPFQGNIFGN